jgi:hypothetical protein
MHFEKCLKWEGGGDRIDIALELMVVGLKHDDDKGDCGVDWIKIPLKGR